MRAEIEDWKNGWFGIELGIGAEELNRFIELLRMLEREPDQHFHIFSDYKGADEIGSIRISFLPTGVESDMHLTSRSYAPGDIIDKMDL
jgi:hypothetical protein